MEYSRPYQIFERYLPDNAVHYCYDLWVEHRFNLKVTAKRNTKLGDYRYNPSSGSHAISINGDLNPYSFLITYIHEVAHLVTFKEYNRKVAPHGKEWQQNFQQLFHPLLSDLVFPAEVLKPLKAYMRKPKASSFTDHLLTRALLQQSGGQLHTHLEDLQPGAQFIFKDKTYKKEARRRTRVLCQEVKTGKKYLISRIALVEFIPEKQPGSGKGDPAVY